MQRPRSFAGPCAVLLFALACSDDGVAGGGGGGVGGEGAGAGSGGAAPCPEETLCLDVVPAGDPAPGRLAVVWLRFEGDVGHDPTIGFEQSFDAESESVEIPLADVTLPPDFDLLCERPCAEPMACPCIGDFKAGVAYLIVAVDENDSGGLDLEEIDDAAAYVGIANTAVVWSATTETSAPDPFTPLFPEGLAEGIAPHRIVDGTYEPADPGSRFELRAGTNAL